MWLRAGLPTSRLKSSKPTFRIGGGTRNQRAAEQSAALCVFPTKESVRVILRCEAKETLADERRGLEKPGGVFAGIR